VAKGGNTVNSACSFSGLVGDLVRQGIFYFAENRDEAGMDRGVLILGEQLVRQIDGEQVALPDVHGR
jgi:hypothetical protein